MERYFNILSFERDDRREKELESVIKSCVVRYNLKRVTNLKDYVGELHSESYDCIVCNEDNLKDFEKYEEYNAGCKEGFDRQPAIKLPLKACEGCRQKLYNQPMKRR